PTDPHSDSFKGSDETYFLDGSFGKFLVFLRQVFGAPQKNILGPEDHFYLLAVPIDNVLVDREPNVRRHKMSFANRAFKNIRGPQKRRDVFGSRVIVDLERCADLFEASRVQHRDTITEFEGFLL